MLLSSSIGHVHPHQGKKMWVSRWGGLSAILAKGPALRCFLSEAVSRTRAYVFERRVADYDRCQRQHHSDRAKARL